MTFTARSTISWKDIIQVQLPRSKSTRIHVIRLTRPSYSFDNLSSSLLPVLFPPFLINLHPLSLWPPFPTFSGGNKRKERTKLHYISPTRHRCRSSRYKVPLIPHFRL